MEFKFVDVSEMKEDELLALLHHNSRTFAFKLGEIRKLKEATSTGIIEIVESPKVVKASPKKESKIDFDFEEEVDYYLTEFRSLKEDELESRLEEVLPVRKNYNFKNIILRIIAELNRDIKEINEIIITEKDIISIDELKEFKKEAQGLKRKIDLLFQFLNKKEDEKSEGQKENKLIFVTTDSGNIRVLDDLSSIPDTYYPNFLELFQSIKDGTFKGVKRFVNNETLRGASEVRGFKTRVIFTRLSKDCYAVLTAITKKTDNDRGYRKPIELKLANYRTIEDILKEKIKDPEFLKLQEDYEKELFRLLGMEDQNTNEKKGDNK